MTATLETAGDGGPGRRPVLKVGGAPLSQESDPAMATRWSPVGHLQSLRRLRSEEKAFQSVRAEFAQYFPYQHTSSLLSMKLLEVRFLEPHRADVGRKSADPSGWRSEPGEWVVLSYHPSLQAQGISGRPLGMSKGPGLCRLCFCATGRRAPRLRVAWANKLGPVMGVTRRENARTIAEFDQGGKLG